MPPDADTRDLLLVQPYPPRHPRLQDDPLEFSQPIGLLYLAAAARAAGQTVGLADLALAGAAAPEALDPWLAGRPRVVGLSAPFSLLAPVVDDLARHVKRVAPGTTVVVGGAHASALPGAVLANPFVDAVFLGEAEESFARFLGGAPLDGLDEVGFRTGGDIRVIPKTGWVADLDALPFPARDLLDLPAYWQRAGRAGQGRWTSLVTSRGCPYHCLFCSTFTVWGRRWRPRGPENVLAELRELQTRFAIDTISLEDDNFTLDLVRAKAILRGVLAEGLRFAWATPNGLRADRLDEELIDLMARTGFAQVKVAVESGHPRVNREVVRKNLDLAKVEEVVGLAARRGIPPSAFFVLGFPEESPAEMAHSVAYALKLKELGLAGADFFMATPYPGTALLAQARERGLLLLPEEELPLANAFAPSLRSPLWAPELLVFMVRLAREAFAGNPFHRELLAQCLAEGPAAVLARGRRRREFSPGEPAADFFLQEGWHDAEDWPPACRWTRRRAGLRLAPAGEDTLELTVCTHAPELARSPVVLSVTAAGRELGRVALGDPAWREVALPLPRGLTGELELTLAVDRVFTPGREGRGDQRVLGMAVARVALRRRGFWARMRRRGA